MKFHGQLLKTSHTIQDIQSKMRRFTQSLQYEARLHRHEAISEAHEQTFRWLLGDNEDDSQVKSGFPQWLESNDGIFWVTGKPGSGKSTFMKFVAGAARTRELLDRWAYPTILVAHYFWSPGSSIQKSQEGLLRSLLYEMFRQCPDLIPVTCEERWRQLDDPAVPSGTWSSTSLMETFRKVAMETSLGRVNFCFFIDGLDEFGGSHGDQLELCKMVCELAQYQHIKLCVSSRPWNVFEDAFGAGPKMYIHHLTGNDIRNYVSCRLREHPRWIDLPFSTLADGQRLIDQIAERSDGVFLWVVLVTKLLREGMTNRDRLADLCRRLDSFPRELGPLFRHIMDSVEPIYHVKMATMLQVALVAEKPLHMLMYDFHDLEHDDEYHYLKRRFEPLTKDEFSDVKSRVPYYIDSRTRGLLEVSSSQEVTFLHRTVKDYLAEHALSIFPEIQLPKGSSRAFNPHLSILRAYAAWVKCAVPDTLCRHDFANYYSSSEATDGITPSILKLTTELIPYAVHLDPLSRWDRRIGEVVDDIDNSIATLISRTRSSAGSACGEAWGGKQLRHEHRIDLDRVTFQEDYEWKKALFFRESLIKAGATNYVAVMELKEPTIREPQDNKRYLGGNHCLNTETTRYGHQGIISHSLRWSWKVYLVVLKRFLFILCPFICNLSSGLIKCLPHFLTRLFLIPLLSSLVKFVYGNDG
ncbi:hypothetical protein KVR01_003111 [Diaporthe batatas]|uniref:uncharacterized protein n=1 Tax=Diaporthe batatas TaxID=748121 RepID=UPI001D057AC3|nr:uncharacterized protein KVR01_003111 [Diaporthe batatas]KAG8167422.1 hypothetical protein KVR01_003111 [Diaporthe batatas]